MFVLGIPLRDGVCSSSKDAKEFAKVFVNNGKVEKIEYVKSRDDLVEGVHFFVTPKEEFVFDFIEMGAEPLMCPREGMGIYEVVEAFLFKELYSYGSI
ncbi:MAG: hypothetical protein ABGX23_00860 [Nautiliaceae bacterium]